MIEIKQDKKVTRLIVNGVDYQTEGISTIYFPVDETPYWEIGYKGGKRLYATGSIILEIEFTTKEV